MKRQVFEFNLAETTPEEFNQMLAENRADRPELHAILDALFQMWSAALQFSAVAVQYGEDHYDEFTEEFLRRMGPQHGVSPERMLQLLKMIKEKRRPSDASLH